MVKTPLQQATKNYFDAKLDEANNTEPTEQDAIKQRLNVAEKALLNFK